MGKASLAQLAERWTFNPTAAGSSPAGGFPFFDFYFDFDFFFFIS